MAIIREFHGSKGIVTRELTGEEIEQAASMGDIECRQYKYKQHEVLEFLHGLTYVQLETYIENNVTNLATAKEFLKKLAKVVLLIIKFSRLNEDD